MICRAFRLRSYIDGSICDRTRGDSLEETSTRLRMSDGFEIFTRLWRPDEAATRAVVCLHGIEAHSGAFGFLGREMAKNGANVYAFDRRGFGNSREPDLPRGDTHSFARHLADLDEVVRAVRLQDRSIKVFLVAHSIGCAYALWYAVYRPESIDGIVLAAPPAEVGFKVPARDAIRFPFLKLFRPHSTYNLLDTWPKAFKDSEEHRLIAGDELCTAVFGVGWLLSLQTKLANKIVANASRTVKPALIIQGGADIIALPGGAKMVLDKLATRDKVLRSFDDADHWFYQTIIPKATAMYTDEKRSEVSAVVVEFLSNH